GRPGRASMRVMVLSSGEPGRRGATTLSASCAGSGNQGRHPERAEAAPQDEGVAGGERPARRSDEELTADTPSQGGGHSGKALAVRHGSEDEMSHEAGGRSVSGSRRGQHGGGLLASSPYDRRSRAPGDAKNLRNFPDAPAVLRAVTSEPM